MTQYEIAEKIYEAIVLYHRASMTYPDLYRVEPESFRALANIFQEITNPLTAKKTLLVPITYQQIVRNAVLSTSHGIELPHKGEYLIETPNGTQTLPQHKFEELYKYCREYDSEDMK